MNLKNGSQISLKRNSKKKIIRPEKWAIFYLLKSADCDIIYMLNKYFI
jgi:hypothetical protein